MKRITPPTYPLERLFLILSTNEKFLLPSRELAEKVHLTLPQLRQYLHIMVTKGLLVKEQTETRTRYTVTSRGQHFCSWYRRLQQELGCEKSA
jgi:predicted transcriptional regulator